MSTSIFWMKSYVFGHWRHWCFLSNGMVYLNGKVITGYLNGNGGDE